MERYRLEVGRAHGVKPGNIVGAIANEAEVDSAYIGRVLILDDHSLVDLPEGMPKAVLKHLQSVWVSGQKLRISRLGAATGPAQGGGPAGGKRAPKKRKGTRRA